MTRGLNNNYTRGYYLNSEYMWLRYLGLVSQSLINLCVPTFTMISLNSSVAFIQLSLADVLLRGAGTRKAHFEDAALPGLVRLARGSRRVRGQRGRALRRRHGDRRLRAGQLRDRGKRTYENVGPSTNNSFNICEMGCVNPRPKAVRTREHATLPTDTCIRVDLFGGSRH